MKSNSEFPERIRQAFEPSQRGVVALVDDLLDLCREGGLQLEWHDNECRVNSLGTESFQTNGLPLGKSVFRAMLARVAALCNERTPNSVSPYGGEGDLSISTDPPAILHVAFTNTPGEQWMEVRLAADRAAAAADAGTAAGVRFGMHGNELKST